MRRVYLIIFDKSGRSLSGWHYGKIRRIGGTSIQKSAIRADDVDVARGLAQTLRGFGVQKIRVYKAVDITEST